jgi:hypothetical protein
MVFPADACGSRARGLERELKGRGAIQEKTLVTLMEPMRMKISQDQSHFPSKLIVMALQA